MTDLVIDNRFFSLKWTASAIVLGVVLQILSWVAFTGLFTGWSAFFVVGVLIGVLSPGRTIAEPAVAGFIMATIGFITQHIWLSIAGAGLIAAVFYGAGGLLLALLGAVVGEGVQSTVSSSSRTA